MDEIHKNELHACHECDLLVTGHAVEEGQKAVCPRCGAVLFENKPDTINRTLALTIAGLFLFWPANLLPILSLNIMGLNPSTLRSKIKKLGITYKRNIALK